MASLKWRKVHLPSVGITLLLIGALLRLVTWFAAWPIGLVIVSQVVLYMAVVWVALFDLFPLFLPLFHVFRDGFAKRYSFFISLLVLFAAFQVITVFLPSGAVKDTTTTLAFLSFISSIVWLIGLWVITKFTPFFKHLRMQTRVDEVVTFGDVITSMAVVLIPTVLLSFFFLPVGLKGVSVTPSQVFLTSLLTDVFMLAYVFLFVIRPKVFTWKQLGIRKVDKEDLGRSVVLFLVVLVGIVIIEAFLRRIGLPLQRFVFTSNEGAIFAFVITVVVTPFVEELYFRGFLFKGLLMHHRPWIAYVVSAGLFAVLHPPLLAMVHVFFIGLLLAYLVRETKSIWPSVLIHMLNNAVVFGYLLFVVKV